MTNQTKEEFIKFLNNSKITGHIDGRHLIQIEKASDGERFTTLDNLILEHFDNLINEKIVQIELKKIERQGAYNTADLKLGEMKGLDLAIAILKE